ncbi:MAG: hypothetical protein FJX74_23345 [Armatimonadetes bacterium]|nr:hypothetical protein [Armatimonadota bacterium]
MPSPDLTTPAPPLPDSVVARLRSARSAVRQVGYLAAIVGGLLLLCGVPFAAMMADPLVVIVELVLFGGMAVTGVGLARLSRAALRIGRVWLLLVGLSFLFVFLKQLVVLTSGSWYGKPPGLLPMLLTLVFGGMLVTMSLPLWPAAADFACSCLRQRAEPGDIAAALMRAAADPSRVGIPPFARLTLANAPPAVPPELHQWIAARRAEGCSEEAIRLALRAAGWPEDPLR